MANLPEPLIGLAGTLSGSGAVYSRNFWVRRIGAAACDDDCVIMGRYRESSRIIVAAFSAIIAVGVLVLPEVIVGITDASATRKPVIPRKRRRSSTTASG